MNIQDNYLKNKKRNNFNCEINNQETFEKILEIHSENKENFDLYFSFVGSGMAKLVKKNNENLKKAKKLTSRKYSIKNYVDFDHPHQKKIRSVFSTFTENKIMNKDYGIDGCSAPQYGFKIKNLGKALRNLYKSYKGKYEYAKDVKMMILFGII